MPDSVSIAGASFSSGAPALASGFGYGWVGAGNHVWQVAPSPVGIDDSFSVQGTAGAIAIGTNAVWAADTTTGTILRINPNTDQTTTIHLHHHLASIATGDGQIWIAVLP